MRDFEHFAGVPAGMQHFERAARTLHGNKRANKRADTRAIDLRDVRQVHQHVADRLSRQLLQPFAEGIVVPANHYIAVQIDNRDFAGLPRRNFQVQRASSANAFLFARGSLPRMELDGIIRPESHSPASRRRT